MADRVPLTLVGGDLEQLDIVGGDLILPSALKTDRQTTGLLTSTETTTSSGAIGSLAGYVLLPGMVLVASFPSGGTLVYDIRFDCRWTATTGAAEGVFAIATVVGPTVMLLNELSATRARPLRTISLHAQVAAASGTAFAVGFKLAAAGPTLTVDQRTLSITGF